MVAQLIPDMPAGEGLHAGGGGQGGEGMSRNGKMALERVAEDFLAVW